jgi:hypothetical protein
MTTPFDLEGRLRWTDPLPEDDSAEDAFRGMYPQPVTANGATLTAADLAARARALQATASASVSSAPPGRSRSGTAARRTSSTCTEPCVGSVEATSIVTKSDDVAAAIHAAGAVASNC